jgi:hypothetical protein
MTVTERNSWLKEKCKEHEVIRKGLEVEERLIKFHPRQPDYQ